MYTGLVWYGNYIFVIISIINIIVTVTIIVLFDIKIRSQAHAVTDWVYCPETSLFLPAGDVGGEIINYYYGYSHYCRQTTITLYVKVQGATLRYTLRK